MCASQVPTDMGIKTPVHRTIRLDLEHNSTEANAFGYFEDFHYVDISEQLSAMNSRLYRQGRMYSIANITVHDKQGDAYVKFCTVPNTWPMHRAWCKGFENWLNMNAQTPTVGKAAAAGKYNDYRVYLNDDHRTDTDEPMFTDVEGGKIRQSEHNYSRYFSSDGGGNDEFTAHMMGEHTGSAGAYTSVSLIEAYEETLNQPITVFEEPDMATGVWNNLMEVAQSNDDITDALADDYDGAPWDTNVFPGAKDGSLSNAIAPWCARETHLASTTSPMSAVGGFDVPLGLLCIETATKASYTENEPNVIGLQIELVPGKYKGVHAPSMGTPTKTKNGWRVV